MRFHLDCLKYDFENELMNEEYSDYAEHSLPPMSDPTEISPSFVPFSCNMNENFNMNIQISHDEEGSQSLVYMHALMKEDKSENVGGKPALELEDGFDTRSDNFIASQQMQMPRLEQQTNSLSKNISTQRYDLKPYVYDESDEQGFFHDDSFKCIIPETHFSLYPDVFSDDNFPPLSIKDISKSTEDYSNDSSLGFQDKKTAIEHPLVIFKQEPLDLPCRKIFDEEEKYREACKIIYDSYFDDDDAVDLSQVTQQSSDIERYSNSRIISVNPHSRVMDPLHDFTIQDNISIYDSYHEQTTMHVPNHNLFPDSQDGIQNCSDPIILANSCEKEDISSQSQLCCNISCTNIHYILSHLHSFCTKSDCVLNFQTFDRLLWYIEHLIKEHSKDFLPLLEN